MFFVRGRAHKKIPGPIISIRGFPFFILKIYTQPLTSKAVTKRLGRSSDSLALSAAFPFRNIRTVAHSG
jgi:ABC-type methionine transport system permease subunit